MKGCFVCEGREPEKRPDMTIEEIEESYNEATSEASRKVIEEWIESRPPMVKEVAKKFPPHQLYRVKEGNPYRYTPAGCIVTILKVEERFNELGEVIDAVPWFQVLRSPIGYADIVTPFDEEWLEPITLEQLKELVRKEGAN